MDVIVDLPAQRRAACVVDLRDRDRQLSRGDVDPDRAAYVTYHVGVGTWKRARAVADEACRAGWSGSFYADPAYWVVRLVTSAAPTATFIEESDRFMERLAGKHDGDVLAVTVEEPLRDDSWDALAARIGGSVEVHEDVRAADG